MPHRRDQPHGGDATPHLRRHRERLLESAARVVVSGEEQEGPVTHAELRPPGVEALRSEALQVDAGLDVLNGVEADVAHATRSARTQCYDRARLAQQRQRMEVA